MERKLLFTFGLGKDCKGNQLRSASITVRATTNLGSFPESSSHEVVTGKLLDITKQELLHFSSGNDTWITLAEGDAAYRVVRLREDGAFELSRIEHERPNQAKNQ
jgi:hypothetical protein